MDDEIASDNTTKIERGYGVAAALLWEDRYKLPLIFLILAILRSPGYIESLSDPLQVLAEASTDPIHRLEGLLFLAYLTLRALRRISLSESTAPFGPSGSAGITLRIVGYGMVPWLFAYVLELIRLQAPALEGVASTLVLVGVFLLILYHFYFMPIALGVRGVGPVLRLARQYTLEDWALPFRTLVLPGAVTFFLIGLLGAFSADGRNLFVLYLAHLLAVTPTILTAYLSVAFGLAFLGARDLRPPDPKPYYEQILASLAVRGPLWLKFWLRLRNGMFLFFVATVLLFANLMKEWQSPPNASVQVETVDAADEKVTVKLRVNDPDYRLRGFEPYLFSLRDKKGTPLAARPERVFIDGAEFALGDRFPTDSPRRELRLEFPTERTKPQIEELSDIHLWYRMAKVAPVNFKKSRGAPPALAAPLESARAPAPSGRTPSRGSGAAPQARASAANPAHAPPPDGAKRRERKDATPAPSPKQG